MAAKNQSKNTWRWCLASYRRISDLPAWNPAIPAGEGRYICPDCGRVVGVLGFGDGQALARHAKP